MRPVQAWSRSGRVARVLRPPTFDSPDAYGSRLGDVDAWRPYAAAALARCGLAEPRLVSGFEGTYPTLVGDRLVVKLFGHVPGWRASFDAEVAANRVVEQDGGIAAPRVLARGSLFPGEEAEWPFLVTERLGGRPWREAGLPPAEAGSVARQLGAQIRRLHDAGPDGPRADALRGVRQDRLGDRDHGRAAAERHRAWGSLPAHLLDQVPGYLAGYRAGRRCLVHGDLTEDHLFVRDGELLGIIDWGDALVTDPFYELGALHLGAFAGDRELLGHFLDGYGWRLDGGFPERALQVALMHEFDLFGALRSLTGDARSLADLATGLWTPGG